MEKTLLFKIVLVGDSNVGKTTIINSFVVIKYLTLLVRFNKEIV